MKLAFAAFFYFAAFIFIYAAFAGMPDAWEQLSTGFPETPRDIVCALLLLNGMAAKLAGHVCLLSIGHAKKSY